MRVAVLALLAMWGTVQESLPVPKKLIEARRAFLANGGVELRAMKELAARLHDWNRFELVNDEASAEVIVTLSQGGTGDSTSVAIAGTAVSNNVSTMAWTLTVSSPRASTLLHGDRETVGVFNDLGGIKNLVRRLRETIEGASTPASDSSPATAADAAPSSTPIASAAEPCRVFVTETAVNPSWYEKVADLKFTKKWYGSGDDALRALAKKAWAANADAVVAVKQGYRPAAFSWASPWSAGVAVRWKDEGRQGFGTLKGRCFDREQ